MKIQIFAANRIAIAMYHLLFSKTTWKAVFVLVSIASMYGSYWFAKQTYNFKCSEGGYFVSKSKCGEFNDNAFAAKELHRLETLQANNIEPW